MREHPQFGLAMPETCPGVPSEALDPRTTWADGAAYDAAARAVAKRFQANFAQFEPQVDRAVTAAGIHPKS
jgi:phosphoenolpyruvate carboxykinase (ATP)